jgi:hypothetical protein
MLLSIQEYPRHSQSKIRGLLENKIKGSGKIER